MKFVRQQLNRIQDKLSDILGSEDSSPLTEMRDPNGLVGFSGGTEQERQAAIEAATKAEG